MLFRKSPEKFWNLIAARYAASPIADRAAYETKLEKIKAYLSPEAVVLDIGCGTGTQCGDLAGDVKQVTGIDISSKLLAIAGQRMVERQLENIEFINTTLFDERLKAESFDLVMAFFVLHFFEDIDAAFQRIHDLLKPGGLFISETACIGEQGVFMGKALRLAGALGLVPRMSMLTTQQLEQALEKSGFQLIDKIKYSNRSDAEYTLFARKG